MRFCQRNGKNACKSTEKQLVRDIPTELIKFLLGMLKTMLTKSSIMPMEITTTDYG